MSDRSQGPILPHPVNLPVEVDSLIPRDLRLVLSVLWLISGSATFKKA